MVKRGLTCITVPLWNELQNEPSKQYLARDGDEAWNSPIRSICLSLSLSIIIEKTATETEPRPRPKTKTKTNTEKDLQLS